MTLLPLHPVHNPAVLYHTYMNDLSCSAEETSVLPSLKSTIKADQKGSLYFLILM